MAMIELVLSESSEEGLEISLLCELVVAGVGGERGPPSAYPIAWMARMSMRTPMVLASAAAIHPIKDNTIETIYTG